jgi:hypothetical protein
VGDGREGGDRGRRGQRKGKREHIQRGFFSHKILLSSNLLLPLSLLPPFPCLFFLLGTVVALFYSFFGFLELPS